MRLAHAAALGVMLVLAACTALAAPSLEGVKLPPGFKIEVWQDNLPLAREMAFGPKGTVFVGTMSFGSPAKNVFAIRNVGGKRTVTRLLTGLNNPNGVAV